MNFTTRVPSMGIDITTPVPDVPDLPRYPTAEDRRRRKVALAVETRATRQHRDAVRAAVEDALNRPGCYVPAPSPAGAAPGYTGWAAACEWLATRDAWTMIGADGCSRTFLADVAQRFVDARHFGRIDRKERDAANARGYRARKASTPDVTAADTELAELRAAADRAARTKGGGDARLSDWSGVARRGRNPW